MRPLGRERLFVRRNQLIGAQKAVPCGQNKPQIGAFLGVRRGRFEQCRAVQLPRRTTNRSLGLCAGHKCDDSRMVRAFDDDGFQHVEERGIVFILDMINIPEPRFHNGPTWAMLAEPSPRRRVEACASRSAEQRDRVSLDSRPRARWAWFVFHFEQDEAHPPDVRRHLALKRRLGGSGARRDRSTSLSPTWRPRNRASGPNDKRLTDVLTKDRSSMIAAARSRAPMLQQAVPKPRARTGGNRVRSNAHHTRRSVAPTLAVLKEEVNASSGPGHFPVATAQTMQAGCPLLPSQQVVQPTHVRIESTSASQPLHRRHRNRANRQTGHPAAKILWIVSRRHPVGADSAKPESPAPTTRPGWHG